MRRKVLGVSLGGGGSRGIAHLGVLQVLEEAKIKIDCLAGTSSGAIVGALYAYYGNTAKVKERIYQFLDSELINDLKFNFLTRLNQAQSQGKRRLSQKFFTIVQSFYLLARESRSLGLIEDQMVDRLIESLIPDIDFPALQIPFVAIAADLRQGKEVYLNAGSLRIAVKASISRPGVFLPVYFNEQILTDGGVVSLVPVDVLRRLGANFIVAVDVHSRLRWQKNFRNGLDIINRANNIAHQQLLTQQLEQANVVIRPRVGHIYWTDFRRRDYLVRRGEEAGRLHITQIKRQLSWWRNFFK